jgi:hypothetical protein
MAKMIEIIGISEFIGTEVQKYGDRQSSADENE